MADAGGSAVEIRRARVDDLPLVQDFIDATYGAEARFKHSQRIRWQFIDTPYKRAGEAAPTVFVAVCDNRVVGTIGVQDGCAWVGDRRVPMGWVVDVMVHPEFRGRGLGHRIHARALLDRQTLITLTMAEATRRIAQRAGCITLGPTREFVRPLRVSAKTIGRFLDGKAANDPRRRGVVDAFKATRVGPVLSAGGLKCLQAVRKPTRIPLEEFAIEEVDRFPRAMDALWDKVADRQPALFERTVRFLNWRFCDVPELAYRRFLLWRDGAVRGYVVTRTATEVELPVGTVVDLLATPGDSEALDALLAHAVAVLTPHSEYIEAAASATAQREAFTRAGFLATRTMRPTVVCTDPELMRTLSSHRDDWLFTKADHDWDQIHPA